MNFSLLTFTMNLQKLFALSTSASTEKVESWSLASRIKNTTWCKGKGRDTSLRWYYIQPTRYLPWYRAHITWAIASPLGNTVMRHTSHPELSGCITTLTLEVANFGAAIDTLIDQDAYKYVGRLNPLVTILVHQVPITAGLVEEIPITPG